jgi:arylamine N-acetyltransferase
MDVALYLARIGLAERPPATLEGLRLLQRAHTQSVPFENLDVVLRRPLSLAPAALFDKVVVRRRGGYCFELNSLYGLLLAELGFAAVPHLARVWLRDPPEPPPRTHLTHSVTLDGRRWLTDVGFGGNTPRVPVPFEQPDGVEDGGGPIRVVADAQFGFMLQRRMEGDWANQFSFDDLPALPADVMVANHYVETHPASHFRSARYVGLFTPEGRDGLVDQAYTRRTGARIEEEQVPLGPAWVDLVAERFGIDLRLTPDEAARLHNDTTDQP